MRKTKAVAALIAAAVPRPMNGLAKLETKSAGVGARATGSTISSRSYHTPARDYSSSNQPWMCGRCSSFGAHRTNHSLSAPNIPSRRRGFASSTSPAEGSMSKTPLYDLHVSLGAKMVPFGGFAMPLNYADLSHVESHHWTREKASLFDVSHMVQHKISGPGAQDFLMMITPSSLDKLPENQSTLSCLLSETGGIVDDTVITRIGDDEFYFVTNAGCRDSDIAFITAELARFEAEGDSKVQPNWEILGNRSLVALQGPLAASALQPLIAPADSQSSQTDVDLSTLLFGQCRSLKLKLPDGTLTTPLLISRTGYTGEDGFEMSVDPEERDSKALITDIVNALLADSSVVRMAGLAARDSLRLEAGMCLYGHDISVKTTPPAAGLGWIVGKDRRTGSSANFNGATEICKQLESPKTIDLRRVGIVVEKGAPAREGAEIVDVESSEPIGRITSGLPSPTLGGQNIAMALVKNGYHKKGQVVGVKVRKNVRKGEVAKMPFVPNKFYRG